jgi:hypothetical protein
MLKISLQQLIEEPMLAEKLTKDNPLIKGDMEIELQDGYASMSVFRGLVNTIILNAYTDLGIVPVKSMITDVGTLSKGCVADAYTKVYKNLLKNPALTMKMRVHSIFNSVSRLIRFIYYTCGEYTPSICLSDMCDIVMDPKILALKKRIHDAEKDGPQEVEVVWKECVEEFVKLTSVKGELINDALYYYQKSKSINPKQAAQMFLTVGVRTDIDDKTITKPIRNNFVEGMDCIEDIMVESRSAVKVDLYNKVGVGQSQYVGKGVHLLCTPFEKVYDGDCGNPHTIKFYIDSEDIAKSLIGKTIIVNGKDVCVDEDNYGDYVKQSVNLVSVLTCRCKNGVCERCGGDIITNYIPRGLHPGMTCSVRVIGPTTQLVLSAKHFIVTITLEYTLSNSAAEYFKVDKHEIYALNSPSFRKKLKTCKLGIPTSCLSIPVEAFLNADLDDYAEAKISEITDLLMKASVTGVCETLPMDNLSLVPFLSKEFIQYIRDNQEILEIKDDIIWVPMEGIYVNKDKRVETYPLLRTVICNASMLKFVKSVKSFIYTGVKKKHTRVDTALQEFAEILFSKLNSINIVHVEMLLKALMVTSEEDYRIPIVEDPNNVMFGTADSCIANRSIGAMLSHEKLFEYLENPASYVVPKEPGIMNAFFNLGGRPIL